MKFLNVDDDVSKIVDDPIENAFLEDMSKTLTEKPDDTKLEDIDMTQELQLYIADKFNDKTVTGVK